MIDADVVGFTAEHCRELARDKMRYLRQVHQAVRVRQERLSIHEIAQLAPPAGEYQQVEHAAPDSAERLGGL